MQPQNVTQLSAALAALSAPELLDLPGYYCVAPTSEPTTINTVNSTAPSCGVSTTQASTLQHDGHLPLSPSTVVVKTPRDSTTDEESLLHLLQREPTKPEPAFIKVATRATAQEAMVHSNVVDPKCCGPSGRKGKHRGRGVGRLTGPIAVQACWEEQLISSQHLKRHACTWSRPQEPCSTICLPEPQAWRLLSITSL